MTNKVTVRKIVLAPHETMKQHKAVQRLANDAALVHRIIRTNPGIVSKRAIANATGLTEERVAEVILRINEGETGHTRVEYGECVVTENGKRVRKRGWFGMNVRRYHDAMNQADDHSARVEVGVRRARLVRFAQAEGIPHAEAVVKAIEQRLGQTIEAMDENDLEAFEELLSEEVLSDGYGAIE